MVLSGSQLFSVVLMDRCSQWFLVVLLGSHKFEILSGSQWFSRVLSGSQWLSEVIKGSEGFSVVLSGCLDQVFSVVLICFQWFS